MNLKIMTWNIWSGKNWEYVADFIKKNKIELMGLQEVDNALERTGFVNIAEKISQALGFNFVYSPSIENRETFIGGQFGNCIISKFPIMESERHFLSSLNKWDGTAQTEPRTLLETKIKINRKIINFMTLHLGYSRKFKTTEIKLKQIEKVIQIIKGNKDFPTILAGDFNSIPDSLEIQKIKEHLKDVDNKNKLKTWTMYDFEYQDFKVPAGLKYKIDYIFVSENIKYKQPKIRKNKISDHVPVVVEIDV